MNEALDKYVDKLGNVYQRSIISIITGTVVVFAINQFFPKFLLLPEKHALISKSLIIILFLLSIPLVVTFLRKRMRNLSGHMPLNRRLAYYAYYFRIKSVVFIALSLCTLLAYLFSNDPLMLVLQVSAILFFYFERPSRLKIQEDLQLEEQE